MRPLAGHKVTWKSSGSQGRALLSRHNTEPRFGPGGRDGVTVPPTSFRFLLTFPSIAAITFITRDASRLDSEMSAQKDGPSLDTQISLHISKTEIDTLEVDFILEMGQQDNSWRHSHKVLPPATRSGPGT